MITLLTILTLLALYVAGSGALILYLVPNAGLYNPVKYEKIGHSFAVTGILLASMFLLTMTVIISVG